MSSKSLHFNLLEQSVRSDFRARWYGWMETYQPGLGGGTGVPDIQIMPQPQLLVPIEIKRAFINDDGRLILDHIRPDQVSWHTRFAIAGGRSWFYAGVRAEGDKDITDRFVIPAQLAIACRSQGLLICDSAAIRIPAATFTLSLSRAIT